MKNRIHAGFASLPAVSALGLVMTLSLMMLFKTTLLNREEASQSQLRVDYHQREEALMRALVAIFPERAIACMKGNYAADEDYAWSTIFAEAVTLSSISQTLTPEMLDELGLRNVRSGDVGDHNAEEVQSWITSLSGAAGGVTPGTSAYSQVFSQSEFAGKVPPLLTMSQSLQDADALRPIVTPQKQYNSQTSGLLASVSAFPVYNLIPYPNIRFGYAAPGEPFVAKRNWWAFTVNYGSADNTIAKHYVLSLYEIPSQMPIEAATFASIGKHQDGTAWNSGSITIDGSVYANQLTVNGAFGASRMAGRSNIDFNQTVSLGGIDVSDDFDALGVRERLQAEQRSDVLPVALSANSGRLTFLPIQPGYQFLVRAAAGASFNAWQNYTAGAQRCRVVVEAVSMVSFADQTPTSLRVRFQTTAGNTNEILLKRGVNWPTPYDVGGDAIPFQTELLNNGRSCVTFHPLVLNSWLLANGGATVVTNNSIYFGVDQSADPVTVRPLSDPPAPEDMCVIVRKGKDLTGYTKGMAIVAPLRVYVGDDLNEIPTTVPTGSGLAAGSTFFPPMAIFSAELRVGTTPFNRPIELHGQVGTLNTGISATAWQPLDVKSGSDDTVHTDTIAADLKPARSPAELPPIHQMNWLVVIEEIPQQ